MTDSPTPALIGLDWGTSSLRAQLLGADGDVLETRFRPWGIMHVPNGDFSGALRNVISDWRERWPRAPAVAAGMIGSRQGMREVPYVECPADVRAIAAGLLVVETDCGVLNVIPGVIQRGSLPDVIRGEETQIFGALELHPELANDALLILPGTHCKWVTVRESRIEHFSTFITGELFAALRDHSILGRPALEEGSTPDADAFRLGVINARESGAEGVIGRLFTTRSLYLTGDLSAASSLDYLSGLLIGEELRSVISGLRSTFPPLVLIGEPELCGRYREALALFGHTDVRVLNDVTGAGLYRIATAAGLIALSITRR